jgi:biopolymer transport protein ExbD
LRASELELDEISEINMTPFVDIVLVLLVIFMATATLITENRIGVTLPSSATSDVQPNEKEKITVTIDANSTFFVEGAKVDLASLQKMLADKKVAVLRADAKTDFEAVIAVIDECKKAGITKYQVDTNRK